MQCYTELTPPTAVTHALSLPFLSPSSSALVLAKTSLLQIFTTKSISKEVDTASSGHAAARDNVHYADRRMQDGDGLDPSFLAADMVLQRAERSNDTKLVLLAEHPLSGVVTSLARVKILNSKSGGEALLLAFKDAKLSLVEWDPERHGLSTISIHYYEREDLQGSPWAPDLAQCVNFLTVDPSSRCAALKFGVRNLAILPFRQPGDDLVMDDYDPDIDGERPETNQDSAKQTQEENEGRGTPYNASFVLPLSALDPSLIHPIHLSFLYEYREPTFGIISSSSAATSSLLYERRDLVSYTVFTLDLEQRASTTILSVTGLPYDLFKVIPLPVPIGGALLVGGNELIHIDQAGKTNGVAVNAFARECSSFGMADQSDLRMKLEGCVIEQLAMDVGDMLLVLSTGELAILTFKLDGRSVSGFSVRRVPVESGGSVIKSTASCTASLSRGRMFVGSEESDSVVLGWSRKPVQPARRKSLAEGMEDETFFDVEEIDDYDDDLYSAGGEDARRNSDVFASTSTPSYSKSGDWSFRVHDSLLNIAPLTDLAIGKSGLDPNAEQESPTQDVTADLELVVATGTGKAGGVAMLKREIAPKTIGRFTFPEASGIWSVRAKQPVAKGLIPQASGQGKVSLDGGYAADDEYDRFMIVSRASSSGGEESNVYALTSTGFEEMGGTEFDPAAGGTVDVGLLGGDTRVIQILRSEIRSYDGGESPFSVFNTLLSSSLSSLNSLPGSWTFSTTKSICGG
ncbi:MAG: mRNA cleavage and polyadenylation factor subunit [Piccolia ochrophora]|nr:MAG: mRNA cleavage and polyadenylation factor subunit [Piccolia ochrophora]